jgi:hypothetical protein
VTEGGIESVTEGAVRRAWPVGAATALGPMPGSDIRRALGIVLDTVSELPFLPELPHRGPGADPVGRALALLPDFPADFGPSGWVLAGRPGRDVRRAQSLLAEDLDVFEELAGSWDGATKIQLCGPWTLAAMLEMRGGHKVLSDPGATRDLHQAYAESLRRHAQDVARRLAAAGPWLLQLDEPALPAVLGGGVPTPSGFGRLPSTHELEVEQGISAAIRALPAGFQAVLSCPAAAPPVRLFRAAGAHGVSLDATRLTEADDNAIGEAIEAGVHLILCVVPVRAFGEPEGSRGEPDERGRGAPSRVPDAVTAAEPIRALWHRLGQPPDQLARVVPAPTPGLESAGIDVLRAVLTRCVEVAAVLRDDPEERLDQS